jgi:hypothetical protein
MSHEVAGYEKRDVNVTKVVIALAWLRSIDCFFHGHSGSILSNLH